MANQMSDILVVLGIYLIIYLALCYVLSRVGRKFGVGSFGSFCAPIYNIVLLCRCAGISGWYALVFFIPLVNIVASVYLWGTIAQKLGKNFWIYGLGISLIGIPVFFIAFDSSHPVAEQAWVDAVVPARPSAQPSKVTGNTSAPNPPPRVASMLFLKGDLVGSSLELPHEGIIIGRDPARANLVIANPDISSMHVRIQPMSGNSGGVVVEDLGSTNGTYYKVNGSWQPISSPLPLAGATTTEIRLTDIDIANFQVRT